MENEISQTLDQSVIRTWNHLDRAYPPILNQKKYTFNMCTLVFYLNDWDVHVKHFFVLKYVIPRI